MSSTSGKPAFVKVNGLLSMTQILTTTLLEVVVPLIISHTLIPISFKFLICCLHFEKSQVGGGGQGEKHKHLVVNII